MHGHATKKINLNKKQGNPIQCKVFEENDEMKMRTGSVRCLILISACQKPGKKNSACQKLGLKNSNDNWQTKEMINSEAKSEINQWEKAVKIFSKVT